MDINIQIFGTLKCKDTQKALRYFKERSIKPHFVDLAIKAISPGELDNINASIPLEDLFDENAKEFKRLNLKYLIYDKKEMLLEYPLLFKTPIVRNKKIATVGYAPDIWKNWLIK